MNNDLKLKMISDLVTRKCRELGIDEQAIDIEGRFDSSLTYDENKQHFLKLIGYHPDPCYDRDYIAEIERQNTDRFWNSLRRESQPTPIAESGRISENRQPSGRNSIRPK